MIKVLIVEDEDIIRKGIIYMMDWLKVGCIVVGEASNGNEGLDKIKALKPDIVVTDIRMPFKDGIEMLEESIYKYNYEAIIISGYSEFEYAKKAISLGVNEYLLKPIDFNKFSQTLNKLRIKIEKESKVKKQISSLTNENLYEKVLDINNYNKIENKTNYVANMIKYIRDNYEKKISIRDLSKKYDFSTVSLNSKFKEETNYTFNDFLNRYRILKAVELLKEGDLMVYEIANSVGFGNYKYFSQVFKKYVGSSPTDFINSLEEDDFL